MSLVFFEGMVSKSSVVVYVAQCAASIIWEVSFAITKPSIVRSIQYHTQITFGISMAITS
jgi:hypothetical protein